MSWLFSQALVEEFSLGTCWATEPSAQLNVMPTPRPFWRNDKTMDSSDLSQFGLTSALLTATRGEELLIAYRAASRAKTSAVQELAPACQANAAACGQKWFGLFWKLDHESCEWKTPQSSLLEDSESFSQTWPRSGSMRSGMCFLRPTLAPTTYANASGLLPTPTKSWGRSGPGLSNNLNNLRMSLGVTHTTLAIVEAVGWRWPATFVEWMMGWPLQWTALQPLETGKFQEWQQQHSPRSLRSLSEAAA